MRKLFLAVTILVTGLICSAQQTGRMETDRPDQTESPFTVKKGWIQGEVGFNLEKENGFKTWVHPTILWKYGASKKFEFRLITEAISFERPLMIPDGTETISGILPIQIGGKIAFWEEKGLLPKTSLIFHVAPSKLGSKKFNTDKWAPNFRFTMQNTLSDNIGLGYNVGAEWDGFSNTPAWIYTIAPGFNLGEKWYGYVEAFGAFRKGELPMHALDGGLAYYTSDNAKLDISSGFSLTDNATDWYGAIGFSFRFNTKKKK
jgi:hypothetical protein